jgi:hypothetical protein
VAIANKDEIAGAMLTVVYKAQDTGFPYIKKTSIPSWIIGKDYSLIPEGAQLLLFSTERDFEFTLTYAPKSRQKKTDETFRTKKFLEKGIKAAGVRLAPREVTGATSLAQRTSPSGLIEPELSLGMGGIEDKTGSQDSQDLQDSPDAAIGGLFADAVPAPAREKPAAAKKPAAVKKAATTAKPRAAAAKPAAAKAAKAPKKAPAPAPAKRSPDEAKKALSESIRAKTAAKAASEAKKAPPKEAARPVEPPAEKPAAPAPAPATEHKGLLAAIARRKAEQAAREGEGGKDKE